MAFKYERTSRDDFGDIDRDFGEAHPSRTFIEKLDMLMYKTFMDTQNFVHVDTASLKMSGRVESGYSRATNRWTGEISYGGPSAGVHNPVRYAVYEAARGHYHDFMAPAYASEPSFEALFRTDKIFGKD